MRRIVRSLVVLAAVIALMGAGPACFAEESMTELDVTIDLSYSRCRCEWEEPEGRQGELWYTATVQAVSGQGSEDRISERCDYPYFQADDYIAYTCQEYGFCDAVSIKVEGFLGGEKVAEGFSESFDPRTVFPEKEELLFGTDSPIDSVYDVSVRSFGTAASDNWSVYAFNSGDEIQIVSSEAGKEDVERKLSEEQWNELLSILSKGRMKRNYVSDPTIQMLDGGGGSITVSWSEGDYADFVSSYHFDADETVRQELEDWMTGQKKGGSAGWILWVGTALCIAAVAFLILFFLKKR